MANVATPATVFHFLLLSHSLFHSSLHHFCHFVTHQISLDQVSSLASFRHPETFAFFLKQASIFKAISNKAFNRRDTCAHAHMFNIITRCINNLLSRLKHCASLCSSRSLHQPPAAFISPAIKLGRLLDFCIHAGPTSGFLFHLLHLPHLHFFGLLLF